MSDPLVSILIPTYNGERFLRPALRSALEQSYRNIEVVVGDDASTDRTPQILAAVAESDPRVRIIRHETNVGAFENPLRLLVAARGEYVKFLLHDDVLANDCVRELLRGMQSSPDVSMSFSRRVLIDENGRTRPDGDLKPLMDRPGTIDGRQLGDAILESCTNVIGELTTVLFRRADVDPRGLWQVDGVRVDVLSDVKLWLQLLARGPAYYTPRALSRFRIHSGQNTFHPRFVGRGERDWSRLADWAARNGFLTDVRQQQRAHAQVVRFAAARVGDMIAGPDYGPALEALFLSTARLVELGAGASVDPAQGLAERAHSGDVLDRFSQELAVWTREYPVALAAPALVAEEVGATVRAFRDVLAAGVTKKVLLAVPQSLVEQAVPLVEAALAQGSDIDVELVACEDPAALLGEPWLAVAPRDANWYDGRATAAWTFPFRRVPEPEGG